MTSLRRLVVLLLLLAACLPAAAETLRLEGIGEAVRPLGGPWAFHLGDDPGWASPAVEDAAWERLSADKPWGEQGHPAYAGFAWYRLHLQVTPVPGASPQLALMIPYASDVYEVFWNGQKIGQHGSFPPHARWLAYQKPSSFQLGPQREGVLAIRMWRAPLTSFDSGLTGGFAIAPRIGSPEAIRLLMNTWEHETLRDSQFGWALSLVYSLIALLCLVLWLRRRDNPVLLWLGLFALASVLQARDPHEFLRLSYRQEALSAVLYQPALDIATWFLLLHLLELRKQARLLEWIKLLASVEIGLMLLDGIAVFFWGAGWPQMLDFAASGLILIPELFPVVLVVLALHQRKKLPIASWCVAAFALLTDVSLALGAALSQGQRFTHWTLWKKLLIPLFTVAGNGFSAQTIASTLLLISLLVAVFQVVLRESERRAALMRDFGSAQALQRVLIPETLPTILGYEVSSAYRPAQEVGGDFFQLIPQGGGAALLIIGDVSGKGLTAAMAVALIVGTIRTLAEQLPSPAEMLAGVNRRLVGKLDGGFATCLALRLEPDGGVVMATAGHPGPYLNGEALELPPALPLGLSLDTEFEQQRHVLTIGDHLLLFSDGLLEARGPHGEIFGFDALHALAAGCPDAAATAAAAIAFGQEDDITVVTVTRLRVGAEARTLLITPPLAKAPGLTPAT